MINGDNNRETKIMQIKSTLFTEQVVRQPGCCAPGAFQCISGKLMRLHRCGLFIL